jgi:capsular polysaccharide biosynthesis protein
MAKFECSCKKRMKVVAATPTGSGLWRVLLQCPGCSNVMEITSKVELATKEAE